MGETQPKQKKISHSTTTEQLRAWQAIKALQSVGGLQWKVIFWFLLLVTLVNVMSGWLQSATTALFYLLKTNPDECIRGLRCTITNSELNLNSAVFVLFLAILLLGILFLRVQVRKQLPDMRPIVSTKYPESPIVLILFLSTPAPATIKAFKEALEKMPAAVEDGLAKLGIGSNEENRYFRAMLGIIGSHISVSRAKRHDLFAIPALRPPEWTSPGLSPPEVHVNSLFATCNWRMMVDGIRPYLEPNSNLREIIFVPSSDGERFAGYEQNGTLKFSANPGSVHRIAEAKAFVELIIRAKSLAVGEFAKRGIRVVGCGELLQDGSTEQDKKFVAAEVDYGNLKTMSDTLFDISKQVKARWGCQEQDILVDVTSGTALASISAAAYSTLVESRRFQYVNTNSYETLTFDVTHQFGAEQ